MFKSINLLVIVCVIVLSSCKKDNNDPVEVKGDYSASPWVLNEGAFLAGNAGIDVLYGDGSTIANAYQQVNGTALGDVLQSAIRIGNQAFLVLNGSEKIQILDAITLENKGLIQGISYPRHLYSNGNGKIYLSAGNLEGEVVVIDEITKTFVASIPVGFGPEKMCSFSDKLFVTNSGGWSEDNTLSVISTSSDTEIARLDLSDRPVDCVCDNDGIVWVLCSGATLYDENWNITGHSIPVIHKIDSNTLDVLASYEIGEEGDHPLHLELSADGVSVMYLNDGIYVFASNSNPENAELLIDGMYSAFNVNPSDGSIWTTSFSDYISSGEVKKFSETGIYLNKWEVGIGPNAVVFPD